MEWDLFIETEYGGCPELEHCLLWDSEASRRSSYGLALSG